MLTTASIAFRQAGPELLANMVQALRTYPQKPSGNPAHATGRTERALTTESGDDFLELRGPQHVQALISGRKPTSAGAPASDPRLYEALAQWAEAKGLVLKRGQTYEDVGRALAYRIHKEGTALYRAGGNSGILQSVLTQQFLDKLLARIAAGDMVAISTALTNAIQGT
jgi:hypothetical protein